MQLTLRLIHHLKNHKSPILLFKIFISKPSKQEKSIKTSRATRGGFLGFVVCHGTVRLPFESRLFFTLGEPEVLDTCTRKYCIRGYTEEAASNRPVAKSMKIGVQRLPRNRLFLMTDDTSRTGNYSRKIAQSGHGCATTAVLFIQRCGKRCIAS